LRDTQFYDSIAVMNDMTVTPACGLRERKKQETRSALTWAAVRLTVEHGLENVLVEDIAAAAGVSPRTFNNYFSSKAEAIAARHVDRLRAIAVVLQARATEEPLWEAIHAAVISQFHGERQQDGPPDPRWAAGVKVMMNERAVQAEWLQGSRAAERELAVVIAERIGEDPNSLYPQLAAAAMGVAVQVGLEQWLRADPPVGVTQILGETLQQIARMSNFPGLSPRAVGPQKGSKRRRGSQSPHALSSRKRKDRS
jgi:AcrR family transcriptional regulator